jgi:Fic family protein
LESVNKQALKNIDTIEEIDKLYEKDLEKTMDLINSTNVVDLIKSMFQRPIFNVKTISSLAGVPDSTCRRYLSILEEEQIIYSDSHLLFRDYLHKAK